MSTIATATTARAFIPATPRSPSAAGIGAGGYSDGLYDVDDLRHAALDPRPSPSTKVPDAYSLDNFGSILYAMTSADGRLLMWDPAVGGAAVDAARRCGSRAGAARALLRGDATSGSS